MHNAFASFNKNLGEARALTGLHEFLSGKVGGPISYDDLLRAQFVYSVSAFDKFMHDIILIGMVDTFNGIRTPTDKYLNESISISVMNQMVPGSLPPPHMVFKDAVFSKLKIISFQDPKKIADGLAYIWNESHKWVKISQAMGVTDSGLRIQLRLIADRRNAIVHESDIDPVTLSKNDIDIIQTRETTDFLQSCGTAIYNLVK
ncbi:HEPN domain-containing protein [Cronobacter dublinensis]